MTSKYSKAPAPGLNPRVRPRSTEARAGIASAIIRDRTERGPRPPISLPRLRFMETEPPPPPSARELPPRRGGRS